MAKNIVILHIFPDDKFFDSTADFYDNLPNVDNRYFFFTKEKNYQFKYIKKAERVRIINSLIYYLKELRKKDVDIVFFHTLTGRDYLLTRIIRKNVSIIWWSWGYDIYWSRHQAKPLINIPLYKPLTLAEKNRSEKKRVLIHQKLIAKFYEWIRKGAVKRINYFIPSIPVDYDIMREHCSFFRANPFPYGMPRQDVPFQFRERPGNVLVGNSLTYTNNHLDIFEKLYSIDIDINRKIVVPVSYGNAYGGANSFIGKTRFEGDKVLWLKEFLSRDKYFAVFDNISHAIFGMIRQQGMGNVLYCLRTGIKVYLYKDSVISRQLKELGYIFYTIEEDLDSSSLLTCLSEKEARHNFQTYMSRYDHRRPEDVSNMINEIVSE